MKTTKGDLLLLFDNGHFDIIVHGCNCFHAMGAGIAGQIAQRYPMASRVDRLNSAYGDIMKLSNHTIAHIGDGKLIVNLYSQYFPGKDLRQKALFLGFEKLATIINPGDRIGIPEIGCGIAGGDWNIIGPSIASIMQRHDITYVKYDPPTTGNIQGGLFGGTRTIETY